MNHYLVSFLALAIFIIGLIFGMSAPNITGFLAADIVQKNEVDENKTIEDAEIPAFRLYTRAICQNVSDFIVCRDELLASCGSFEYILPNTNVNGGGIFEKEWKDPRFH